MKVASTGRSRSRRGQGRPSQGRLPTLIEKLSGAGSQWVQFVVGF